MRVIAPANYQGGFVMFRDESIGARSACIHFWREGISALVMQALALAMLAVLPSIAKAEMPASDPNEVRAKLPISHDTPNEWIVARVGSEIIKVGDFKAFAQETIERNGVEVSTEQLDKIYIDSARSILGSLVRLKLVWNEAIHTISNEDMKKAREILDSDFQKQALPDLMKCNKVSTQEELKKHLEKHDRSLDWERQAFREWVMFKGWLEARIPDLREQIENDHRDQLIKPYLDRLRQSTSIWTVFDDQPGGLEGIQPSPNDSPPPAAPITAEANCAASRSMAFAPVVDGACGERSDSDRRQPVSITANARAMLPPHLHRGFLIAPLSTPLKISASALILAK
jgi:hypothetical protein